MMDELLAAFALMLVLEGILPFVYPRAWRRIVVQIAMQDDTRLRVFGLVMMLLGLLLLYLL